MEDRNEESMKGNTTKMKVIPVKVRGISGDVNQSLILKAHVDTGADIPVISPNLTVRLGVKISETDTGWQKKGRMVE